MKRFINYEALICAAFLGLFMLIASGCGESSDESSEKMVIGKWFFNDSTLIYINPNYEVLVAREGMEPARNKYKFTGETIYGKEIFQIENQQYFLDWLGNDTLRLTRRADLRTDILVRAH